jgi:hypothetical protein
MNRRWPKRPIGHSRIGIGLSVERRGRRHYSPPAALQRRGLTGTLARFGGTMDRIAFPYRSSSHLVLLHVVAESGAWEKHGLEVDYDQQISSSEAHRAVPLGEIEFVGGNHVSTYGRRARGDSWVYLGQTVNQVNHQLAVRPDSEINGLADLQGK